MLQNEPEPTQPKESKLKKYAPVIFWGAFLALPAMNMTNAIFSFKTAKLNLEIERLKSLSQ
jgi:hypothetical protein